MVLTAKKFNLTCRLMILFILLLAAHCGWAQSEMSSTEGKTTILSNGTQTLQEFSDHIESLLDQGDYSAAETLLEDKLRLYPDQKKILSLQAILFARQSQWENFFAKANEALAAEAVNDAEETEIRRDMEQWFQEAYDAGIQMARDGLFEPGLNILDQLEQIPFKPQSIAFDRVVIATWQKKFDKAIQRYEQLDKTVEIPEYVHEAMVDAYRETAAPDKLLTEYEQILASRPDDLEYRKAAFDTAMALRDYSAAFTHNEYMLRQDPDNIDARLAEIRLLINRDEPVLFLQKLNALPPDITESKLSEITNMVDALSDEQAAQLLAFLKLDAGDQPLTVSEAVFIIHYFTGHAYTADDFEAFEEKLTQGLAEFPLVLQIELARLYIKSDQRQKAKMVYVTISRLFPNNIEANFFLARMFFDEEEIDKSGEYAEKVLKVDPKHLDALFLKGKIIDRRGEYFELSQHYETILKYYPENEAAYNLKLKALMDMGSSSLVTEAAERQGDKVDDVIAARAHGDIAMQYINWDEPQKALASIDEIIADYQSNIGLYDGEGKYGTFSPLASGGGAAQAADQGIEEERFLRAHWDKFIALRKEVRMREIVKEYEASLQRNMDIPPWIHETAGNAYHYLEQPERALAIYDTILEEEPESFHTRMAKYHVLVDLGRYKEAGKLIDQLDAQTPTETTERGVIDDNWRKADIAITKAWFLMYQDRLAEADHYLDELIAVAPANTNLLAAQAQNHLWRGWPRLALEDFRIVRTMDPEHISGNIGYAQALNATLHKKEAREHIHALAKKLSNNKHVGKMKRQFEVEDMTLVTVNAQFSEEYPGEDEFQVSMRVDEPVTHHHTLYGEWLRRETTNEAGNDITGRINIGDIWRPNNTWQLTGGMSFDYESDEELGFLADLLFRPDDHWTLGAGFESQIISIPLRSRSEGVSANQNSLSATYRLSEQFNTGLRWIYTDFTDGNEHQNILWTTDTALTTQAVWKTRLLTEFNYSAYTEQDVSYFSPDYVSSLYFIPMAEHVWYRRYNKALVDRLYFGFGTQWQKNFGSDAVRYVQYEQDYQFSDTKSWLIGARYNLNYYDGSDVNSFNLYTTLRFKF